MKLEMDNIALEPAVIKQDFSGGTLAGWASYPVWQDIAYDPNFRVDKIIPGDPNISIVQKVTPYTNVDNYAGAQKRLDNYITENSTVTFKCFIKSHLPAEYLKVRFAAGPEGKLDYTFTDLPLNSWFERTVTYKDICGENPGVADKKILKVNAVAFLVKIPDADPSMPIYFGLDDITIKIEQVTTFRFETPEVEKYEDWKPFIPLKHYHRGGTFNLKGTWPVQADSVALQVSRFEDRTKEVFNAELVRNGEEGWSLAPQKIDWDEGMYYCTLRAYREGKAVSETDFTIHVAPVAENMKHPRLWFDQEDHKLIESKLKQDKYSHILKRIVQDAEEQRKTVRPESLVFDLDQFPDEDWLPTWEAWGSRLYTTAEPLYNNALSYSFAGDMEAGKYVREILLGVARFENWTHPWQTKRGRFTEHRSGWWGHRLALAYDLVYDLLSEEDKSIICKAFFKNIVQATHRMYVVNNDISGNTSNWLSHTCGASLTMQAVMYGDSEQYSSMEPYFTGVMLKLFAFLKSVTDTEGGAWGEGLGYNNYSFHTLCQSLPALEKVFNINLSDLVKDTYKEYIWAGQLDKRKYLHFGDTEGNLNPKTNWAWLVPKYNDPLLNWLYDYLKGSPLESNTQASTPGYMNMINKKDETFHDVLYDTEQMEMESPFQMNPVKLLRDVGTTVFRGGWDPDDFLFVMRTGPFYNHQHLDQGSFWLADRGEVFMQERSGSSYYDDPLYQSWYTQPIAHSTVLIDWNHQSQRTGDHKDFAEGFHDHARVRDFLDGQYASFVCGDIGDLYWGKVSHLSRNVLFIKPRTVIMLDKVVPAAKDVDVTLLYQTLRLQDIKAGTRKSSIVKNGVELNFEHVFPKDVKVSAIETPHYLYTLREKRPLEKEGMLTVTARTEGKPLVIANILRTSENGKEAITELETNQSFSTGKVEDVSFALNHNPGEIFRHGDMETDALAYAVKDDVTFLAVCTILKSKGQVIFRSEAPVTCEISPGRIKYYAESRAGVSIGTGKEPQSVTLNGKKIDTTLYDDKLGEIQLELEQGEGVIDYS